MANSENIDAKGVRRHLKKAKDANCAFAFNLGSSPEQHYVLMHIKESKAATIRRDVKNDGSGNKTAYGTFRKRGRVMELTPLNAAPIPNFAKIVKKWLGGLGIKMNVVILDASGNQLESDIEDLEPDPELDEEDDADAQTAEDAEDALAEAEAEDAMAGPDDEDAAEAAEEDEEDPNRAVWEERARLLGPAIVKILGQGLIDDRRLKAIWDLGQAKAAAGEYRSALKTVPPIMELLAAAKAQKVAAAEGAAPAQDPLAAKWHAVEEKIAPRIAALGAPAAGSPAARIVAAWDRALNAANGSDFATAIETAKKVAEALKALGPVPAVAVEPAAAAEPAAGTGTPDEIAELRKRLVVLVDEAKATIAVAPARKTELTVLARTATGHLADRKADEARAALDALESAVRGAATSPAEETPGGMEDDAEADANHFGALQARLVAFSPDVKAAVAAEPSRRAEIAGLVKAAKDHLARKDAAKAAAAIDALQAALASGTPAVKSTSGDTPQKAARAAREIWATAKDQVDVGINKIVVELKSYELDDFDELADKGLAGFTGKLQSKLLAALMNLEGANDANASKAATAAIGAISNYEKFVSEHDLILGLDENPYGVAVNAQQTFSQALADMKSALKSAQPASG